jgi:hypothetical protein
MRGPRAPRIAPVFTHRRTLRPLVWLALMAVLAMALLPTVTHALALQRGGSAWVEVCTPQGMRLVAVDAGDTPAPLQAAAHLEHCPLCALQGVDAGAPPPAPAGMVFLPPGRSGPPPLFLLAPTTLHAWRSAQPRGPPAIS